MTQTVANLTKRIAVLEQKSLQKPGRPRREFWFEGRELTDEYLMQLSDEGYFDSISKLEKDLHAGKNQLRNRYNKAKEKLRPERRWKAMEIVRPIVQECFIPAQYTSSPEIIKNCLQEVLSEGVMYSQVSAPADNEDMAKKQRENIIDLEAVIVALVLCQEKVQVKRELFS